MSHQLRSVAFLSALLLGGCRSQKPFERSPAAAVRTPQPAAAPAPGASPLTGAESRTSAAGTVHFTGEVKQGEAFLKPVAPNLIFRLNPYAEGDSGWRIEILPDLKPLPENFDCSGSVTPPAHGPNDLFLDKPDGMTPTKIVQWNPHQFSFVADASQCKLAWDLFNEDEYPSKMPEREQQAAGDQLGKIATGSGTLTVLDARLGPASEADEYGPILWLRFELTLQFPKASDAAAE